MGNKRFIIIDSNSIIHRAFYALPSLTTKKGELVNAVYGFLLVFFKALKELEPDYVAATFDFPAPTFRAKIFKEYKAKRPPTPKELYQQIPKIKEVLEVFSVPIFEKDGFEADDLIGTIARLTTKKKNFPKIEIIILSGDLDTLQLVDKNTKVYIFKKGVKEAVLYDKAKVIKKYKGLTPEQLPDFKALKGDPSDNIPGVLGIGEKTALELINKFGSLEGLYQELEKKSKKAKEIKEKTKEILLQQKEQAFFSKKLSQIREDVPIDFNLEKCCWTPISFCPEKKEKIIQFFKNFEFYSLISRLSGEEKRDRGNLRLL